MNRRRLLAAAGGVVGGFAGCVTLPDPRGSSPDSTTGGRSSRSTAVTSVAGEELPVPASQLRRSTARDAIPAIVDPAFADDWSGVELWAVSDRPGGFDRVVPVSLTHIRPRLTPDDLVVGVERAGVARAYPLRVLNWHEVVNDDLGGPLLVTYCPLCRSGLTAVRRVKGKATVFGVSGQLWRQNLVMYDRLTDSRWAQVAATAIRGPVTGTTLDLVPSTITAWSAWRADHPDTEVLLPPPDSNTVSGPRETRDYTVNPYGGYQYVPEHAMESGGADEGPHPKEIVVGVGANGEYRAYPLSSVHEAGGVVNDEVGERPVVVAVAPGETLVAYDRTIDGKPLTFDRRDPTTGSRSEGASPVANVHAGGSNWETATGRAVDGPYRGRRLVPANDLPPLFWFSWEDFHPSTTVYGAEC